MTQAKPGTAIKHAAYSRPANSRTRLPAPCGQGAASPAASPSSDRHLFRWRFLLCALFIIVAPLLHADALHPPAAEPVRQPVIGIIIDDLGGKRESAQRVAHLPGPVACAFLPRGAYTHELALYAHSYNKEVMLHLPMQTVGGHALDPGAITLDMTREEMIETLHKDLAAVPHVVGVNNHMGSLITRHPGHMLWLMQELQRRDGLFFVDSRTTAQTVAQRVATESGVPNVSRDVFLDADPSETAVEAQFQRLIELARRDGAALAIGHPYGSTLRVLERELPKLSGYGVRLVPISELIERQYREQPAWQASWSH